MLSRWTVSCISDNFHTQPCHMHTYGNSPAAHHSGLRRELAKAPGLASGPSPAPAPSDRDWLPTHCKRVSASGRYQSLPSICDRHVVRANDLNIGDGGRPAVRCRSPRRSAFRCSCHTNKAGAGSFGTHVRSSKRELCHSVNWLIIWPAMYSAGFIYNDKRVAGLTPDFTTKRRERKTARRHHAAVRRRTRRPRRPARPPGAKLSMAPELDICASAPHHTPRRERLAPARSRRISTPSQRFCMRRRRAGFRPARRLAPFPPRPFFSFPSLLPLFSRSLFSSPPSSWCGAKIFPAPASGRARAAPRRHGAGPVYRRGRGGGTVLRRLSGY